MKKISQKRKSRKKEEDNFIIREKSVEYGKKLEIGYSRLCECGPTHINCMTAKDWLKSQLGVWEFFYEKRDIRNKTIHPATFPISLSKRVMELFTHRGELVLDPFVGSGTTLIAANDLNRNAIGFDLQPHYIDVCENRLSQGNLFNDTKQFTLRDKQYNYLEYC